jgi:hypothetical protein
MRSEEQTRGARPDQCISAMLRVYLMAADPATAREFHCVRVSLPPFIRDRNGRISFLSGQRHLRLPWKSGGEAFYFTAARQPVEQIDNTDANG